MRVAVAVAVLLGASGCSIVSMRAHDPGTAIPICTDSILPPVADGLMFVAASALVAGDIYARRYDRSYCGPGPDGSRPVDGCGYESEGTIAYPFALVASASAMVGAVRHSECHAAYDQAEVTNPHIQRARPSTLARWVAYASIGMDILFGAMTATLFSRY
jgi:hypothetical protein